jgi:hypothetical protein
MKVLQTVQFSFVYEGADHAPRSVIASVTVGTDDGSGMMKQYSTRYELSAANQTALQSVTDEVVGAIKTAEGIV